MSKRKLRLKSWETGNYRSKTSWDKKYGFIVNDIKLITHFDCEENGIYCNAINYYKQYPFSTHDLWIEIVDTNTSALYIAWNKKNPGILNDLGPFWAICDTDRFLKGFTTIDYYGYNSIDDAFNYYKDNYEYAVKKLPKEKYIDYRRKGAELRTYKWQDLKSTIYFNKLSNKMKKFYANKKAYTWND